MNALREIAGELAGSLSETALTKEMLLVIDWKNVYTDKVDNTIDVLLKRTDEAIHTLRGVKDERTFLEVVPTIEHTLFLNHRLLQFFVEPDHKQFHDNFRNIQKPEVLLENALGLCKNPPIAFRLDPAKQRPLITGLFRQMEPRDHPQVLEIENECFEYPSTIEEVRSRYRYMYHYGVVCEFNNSIIGFAEYVRKEHRLKLAVIAVRKQHRRRRIGEGMVEMILNALNYYTNRVEVMVRETNVPAQIFFKYIGIDQVKLEKEPYADTKENAFDMKLKNRNTESDR